MATALEKTGVLVRSVELPSSAPIVDVSNRGCRVQEARLFAALLESGWGLKVNCEQIESLKPTQDFFPFCVSPYANQETYDIPIEIDHSVPFTRFGNIERPLIFPTWLVFCGTPVGQMHKCLVSFQGLPTKDRVTLALGFVEANFGQIGYGKKRLVKILNRLPRSRFRTILLNYFFQHLEHANQFRFRWSDDGRMSMHKVIEKEYWKMLAGSLSVYCPPGDYGWTYRFYEAMFAGALPILEAGSDGVFAKPFHTAYSVSQVTNMHGDRLCGLIEENRKIVTQLLTALDDLRPEHHLK